MKKVLILAVALALTACGGSTKSEQEAVDDVRQALGLPSSYEDQDIRIVMRRGCDLLDGHTPSEVMDKMDRNLPPVAVAVVLDNSAQAFCPEHSESVHEYLSSVAD